MSRLKSLARWASISFQNFVMMLLISGIFWGLFYSVLYSAIPGMHPQSGIYAASLLFVALVVLLRMFIVGTDGDVAIGAFGSALFWLGVYFWYISYADYAGRLVYPVFSGFGLILLAGFSFEPFLTEAELEEFKKSQWRRN